MVNARLDLQDLIENPLEVLDVELKDWMDIAGNRAVQANIARHVAALANNGGGHLLFGFRDDRTENPTTPYPVNNYNRDAWPRDLDPWPDRFWMPGKVARADHRVTFGEWTVAELAAWPRIVAALGAPVMRLFDPQFDLSPEWVANQKEWFW